MPELANDQFWLSLARVTGKGLRVVFDNRHFQP
jgi:hypothetical protein